MATNPDWYRTSYRRNLVDMHIEDWDPQFLSQFSAETYLDMLRRAHVKSAMIYLQSHVGHCNWNSESGHTHASFPNCEREMQRLFDLCHQNGIDVIAYYSLIYNNDAYARHPDWRLRDANGHSTRLDSGKGQYFGGSRYGLCCPNNPDYRAFVLAQLDEIFDRFSFEGIFLDMTFWTRVCHCPACQRRWRDEHGGDIPSTLDWTSPLTLELQRKREDWMQEFCQLVTDKIKSRDPNCSVEHQYSTMMHAWQQGVNRNIAVASDYCGGDFYGGIPQHTLACKLYYNMTRNQPFEYMTSRCYPNLKEHTTAKSEDMLRQSVMATLAHHGAVLLIDAIDPAGTLDTRIYDTYGRIFRDAERLEPYMEGTMLQDVAVLFNLEAKFNPDNAPGLPHADAVAGACRNLQRAHIPYGVFGDWRPEKMRDAKVIVLPDAFNLPSDVCDFISAYVRDGGSVYLSGRTNPELVEDLLGVRPNGVWQTPMAYLVPTAEHADLLADNTRQYPLAVTGHVAKLPADGPYDAVLATLALPYEPPADVPGTLHPDPDDGYDYASHDARFASIHSNPPGRWLDDAPTLVWRRVGKGQVIYSATPFEAADRPANGPLFVRLIERLAAGRGPWSFGADAPTQVELVAFDAPERKRRYISLINGIEGFSVPTLTGSTVRLQVPGETTQILALPDETRLPFTQHGNSVEFTTPPLHICQMFAVDYRQR